LVHVDPQHVFGGLERRKQELGGDVQPGLSHEDLHACPDADMDEHLDAQSDIYLYPDLYLDSDIYADVGDEYVHPHEHSDFYIHLDTHPDQ